MPLTCTCPTCERRGCVQPADGVLAIDVELAFELNGNRFLQHVTDKALCVAHLADVDPSDVLVSELSADAVASLRMLSARAVLLPFEHPDVVRVREGRAAA